MSHSHPNTADLPLLVAVGDVHGRRDLLDDLLGKIEMTCEGRPSRVVFLGDYVDRGEDSAGVLDTLIAFGARHQTTVFLRGNHEQAMLDFLAVGAEADGWLSWGGEETLKSYGIDVPYPPNLDAVQKEFAAALPDAHFRFLMDLPLMHREAHYTFAHAGIDLDRPLDAQRARDLLWIRKRFTQAKIVREDIGTIVHGHSPVDRPENLPWRINVDTGAVWSGKLTAVVIDGEERRFLSTRP